MKMKMILFAVPLAILGAGCQATHQASLAGAAMPAGASVLVAPAGMDAVRAAGAVATALLRVTPRVETAQPASLTALAAQARSNQLSHVLLVSLTQWEDHATEWNGVRDKVGLMLWLYEANTERGLGRAEAASKSRWATFGGDHPEDLLPETARRAVNQIAGAMRR